MQNWLRTYLVMAILAFCPAPAARAEAVLLMFEQAGCYWCGRWDSEIAHIYPKTAEGAFAPLRRIDIGDDMPKGMNITPWPVFTPTFVLVNDGKEVSRIEGYPGEDFFWGLLQQAVKTEIAKNEGS